MQMGSPLRNHTSTPRFMIFQFMVTRHLQHIARHVRALRIGRPTSPLVLGRSGNPESDPDELDDLQDLVVAAVADEDGRRDVVVLVKAWEPPMAEFLDFLGELRAASSPRRSRSTWRTAARSRCAAR